MEAMPIGTERIWTWSVREQPRQQRFIKVSHHGGWRKRWRPASSHWWEQHVGPIPDGYQVFHRDGQPLNDAPENLVLVRENRFRLIFALRPDAARRQKLRRSRAVIRSNRRRALVDRFQIRPHWWYAVLPASRAIVWKPCVNEEDVREIPISLIKKYCKDNHLAIKLNGGKIYKKEDRVEYVTGAQIIAGSGMDGRYEGFMRLIKDSFQR